MIVSLIASLWLAHSAAETPRAVAEPPCVQRWTLTKANSLLAEQRRLGPPLEDFPNAFSAAAVDPKTFQPMETTAGFLFEERPVLWLTPDRRSVVVDERFSSALDAADPTRMKPGETKAVGRLTAKTRSVVDRRALAEFLLKSGAIRTFWHLESTVCLERERREAGSYAARFSGTHSYFTSSEHTGRFSFELTITADGAIVVRTRESPSGP